jgi:hypothetical protein
MVGIDPDLHPVRVDRGARAPIKDRPHDGAGLFVLIQLRIGDALKKAISSIKADARIASLWSGPCRPPRR